MAALEDTAKVGRRRLVVLVPLVAFLGLAGLFLLRLGAGDASRIPSALIGHPAPATNLPPVAGLVRNGTPVPGLDPATFKEEADQTTEDRPFEQLGPHRPQLDDDQRYRRDPGDHV